MMERLEFNNEDILKFDINGLKDIHDSISKIFEEFKLPKDKNKPVLLKPNLNNDMIALTGGTTDLRIIVAVIMHLKKKGHSNIVIGDGPNTGMYHGNIDVFKRLRIKELAKRFDIKHIDFNYADSVEKNIGRHRTRIAKICYDSFFINIPKIKTHTEAKMSCCMKNLVGCNVGLNKRAVHWHLGKSITELNCILKPDLNIIDGLIAMEGDGPSRGMPKKLNLILAGKNSFMLDYYVSKITGIDDISYLEHAKNKGLIKAENIAIDNKYNLRKPKNHKIVNFLLKNYFVLPRYWVAFNWLFDMKSIGMLLTMLNIRQDSFDDDEIDVVFKKDVVVESKINNICPVGLKISNKKFKFDEKCIKCMYCYAVSKHIKVEGNLGFFKKHEDIYSGHWKGII